jgi:beta-phosphoglucomutase-like phosphatase (HAD superfamily)
MKTSVETQHNEHDMHSSDENHTIKFWVVGSSIAKDLRKNRIYKYKKTNITTHDKTVYGAIEFLMSGKLKANNIAYQVGSSDLEDSTADKVVNSIKRLVLDTQRLVPGNNIIINGILPRFH